MSLLRFRGVASGGGGGTKLAPGATWNPAVRGSGYAGGVAAPVMAARSQALPRCIGKFWNRFRARYTGGDFQLLVYAPLPGLLTSHVNFYLEGGAPITSSSQVLDTRGNLFYPSSPVNRMGYSVTVDGAALQAAITASIGADGFGIATAYAEIVSADPNVGSRVLAYEFAYNDHLAADHTYDFGTGQTLTDLDHALQQAQTDGAKHPLFQNHTNGHVEMADTTATNLGWESRGRIQDAAGVTSTWSRTTPIAYNGVGGSPTLYTQYWQLNADWLEFYKLQLDVLNIAGILAFDGSTHFFRNFALGCEIIDSGASPTVAATWFRDLHPSISGYGNSYPAGAWELDECGLKYLQGPGQGAQRMTNCWAKGCYNSAWTPGAYTPAFGETTSNPSIFAARNKFDAIAAPPESWLALAFTVTRATGGGLTSAWVEWTNPGGTSGTTKIELFENGVSIGSYTPGHYPTLAGYNIEDITTWITGHAGWACPDTSGVTRLQSGYAFAPTFGDALAPGAGTWSYNNGIRTDLGSGRVRLSVLGATGAIGTSINWHWEMIQFNNSLTWENCVVAKNQIDDIGGGNTIKTANTTNCWDFLFLDNIFGQSGTGGYQFDGGIGGDHGIAYGCSNDTGGNNGGWTLYPASGATAFTQILNYAGMSVTQDFTASIPTINGVWALITGSPTAFNSGNNSGNVSVRRDVGYVSPFNQSMASPYDWRPAPGGYLTTNLKKTWESYDNEGNLRADPDADGAFAKDAPALLARPAGY